MYTAPVTPALVFSVKPHIVPVVIGDPVRSALLAQNGFRVVPVLQPGQTFAEAMAGLQIQYVYTSAQDPVDNPNIPYGVVTLDVTDSSTYRLSNGGGLTIVNGPLGQQYIVTIIEEGDEDIEPDSGPGGSGGVNPAENVTTTVTAPATGYVPTTSATDGASLASASGGLVFLTSGAGTWVDGQPILAYTALEIGGSTAWVRAFEADQTVPTGAAALGVGGTFVLPDMVFSVGAPGRRLMLVPASSAVVGAAVYGGIYQIQS